MNIFNLIFKHKKMSDENNEPQTEETNDEVKEDEKADEVFRDKPENAEGGLKEELSEDVEEKTTATDETTEDTETILEEADDEVVEKETKDEDEGETVPEMAEPLYQKKVYIVDLNNIGFKIEGEGELVVDVMAVKDDKATIKNGDLTMEVPKEFLF